MPDKNHNFIDLLEVTGLDTALEKENFAFFFELKRALGYDSDDEEDKAVFKDIKTQTDSLLTDHGQTLHNIIEEWSLAVMKPFMEEMNSYGTSEKLGYSFHGPVGSAELRYENIDGFMKDTTERQKLDIHEVICEWSHSAQTFSNFGELCALIGQAS